MRRTIGFVALWFVAGAAATIVAWLGVSTVSDQLAGSGSHPDPLSAEEIGAEVAAAPTTTTTLPTGSTASTTSTTVPAATTSTTVRSTATTQVAPPTTAPPPVVRSYELIGGTATLRFSAAGVTVVVATPKPGFTVDIGGSHSGGVRVEFEGDDHRSRLDGWWDGGPQDEVREDD